MGVIKMQFSLRHLLVIVTVLGILSGLIRAASLAPYPFESLFFFLAIWFSLSLSGNWLLGLWPWSRSLPNS